MHIAISVSWGLQVLKEAAAQILLHCRKGREGQSRPPSGRGGNGQGRHQQGRGRGRGPLPGRGTQLPPGGPREDQAFSNGGFPRGPGRNGGRFPFNGGFGPMPPPFNENGVMMPNFGLPFGSFPPARLPPMVRHSHCSVDSHTASVPWTQSCPQASVV